MGDSRKYPYLTTGGILEFRRHGGVRETGIPKAWGGFLRLEFRQHGGCFDLDFQRGKRTRDSLDDADCVRRL